MVAAHAPSGLLSNIRVASSGCHRQRCVALTTGDWEWTRPDEHFWWASGLRCPTAARLAQSLRCSASASAPVCAGCCAWRVPRGGRRGRQTSHGHHRRRRGMGRLRRQCDSYLRAGGPRKRDAAAGDTDARRRMHGAHSAIGQSIGQRSESASSRQSSANGNAGRPSPLNSGARPQLRHAYRTAVGAGTCGADTRTFICSPSAASMPLYSRICASAST